MLKNKTVILGVTGCIAAYKSAELVRQLSVLGADVWVAMTDEATKLVTPLTFRTLSGNPVITDLFSEDLANIPIPHISLSKKADLIVVAPATANILAKAAQGIADDPLTTIILSAKCPVMFAPAMNTAMWENEATKENVRILRSRGFKFVGPERGPLACGDEGYGRMSPVETIIEEIKKELLPGQDLIGTRMIVTAGPTREAIDPVRFISNRSSGKMGYAIAEEAAKRGAKVTLISGPTDLERPSGMEHINVESSDEMREAVEERFGRVDAVIMAAAVADFTPSEKNPHKLKKSDRIRSIELRETTDILKELGKKKKGQILIGFSLETEDLTDNSMAKLRDKNLDMIVANDVSALEADTNAVSLLFVDGTRMELEKTEKRKVAGKILDSLVVLLKPVKRPLLIAKRSNE
jgi:phosphopantothenoylcysteine decarboxylase/phosphopantothenate--cysteine ligase